MFDKLKNIKITNEFEPRMEFEIVSKNNNGTFVTKKYDVCLSMIYLDGDKNADQVLETMLKDIFEYAQSCE